VIGWEQAWERDKERAGRASHEAWRVVDSASPTTWNVPWERLPGAQRDAIINAEGGKARYRQAYLAGQASLVETPSERGPMRRRWFAVWAVTGHLVIRLFGRDYFWPRLRSAEQVEAERDQHVEDRFNMQVAVDRSRERT
jgi:hypothetical protein